MKKLLFVALLSSAAAFAGPTYQNGPVIETRFGHDSIIPVYIEHDGLDTDLSFDLANPAAPRKLPKNLKVVPAFGANNTQGLYGSLGFIYGTFNCSGNECSGNGILVEVRPGQIGNSFTLGEVFAGNGSNWYAIKVAYTRDWRNINELRGILIEGNQQIPFYNTIHSNRDYLGPEFEIGSGADSLTFSFGYRVATDSHIAPGTFDIYPVAGPRWLFTIGYQHKF